MIENPPSLAVIGGSGLYTMPGLQDIQEHDLTTPFGQPSTPIVVGTLQGLRIAFLARHGFGHHISPTEVNYAANIYALKSLGVTRVVGISACGSLREDFVPGELAIPDQLFDLTRDRRRSFFGDGLVVHVGVADPFCSDLSAQLLHACQATGATVHMGGAFITIEGPRFSTKAESNTYRAWGMSLIGMTTSPEAFLAREAELCYAVMAHITDYDVWHLDEEPVSVEAVIAVLIHNTQVAQQAIANLATALPVDRDCACAHALRDALITNHQVIPPETRHKLDLLVGKYLP
ncbi:MAG TPA: S-methyl-5'-thioadenosine phosphorylase [Anaerolineales bacterium]|nr:S-methyl-5'-thioadenosine phosphorylase [Anaerolineales bacterium]